MTEFPENNYVQFYGFYFEMVKEPFVIEALSSNDARNKLRLFAPNLPKQYLDKKVVGQTVTSPIYGQSEKIVNNKKYIWVGNETPDGWMEKSIFITK